MADQTQGAWLESVGPRALGTGIFVTADAQGEIRKLFVPNMTHAQAVVRGRSTEEFKWVPHTVAVEEQLREAS